MDLLEAKIAEIKNLDLVYIFTTDSILKDKTKEYVGAKIVYDKDKVLSLDYKNKHFGLFLKKVLERYNKEKDKRNIILLGDLTKKIVQDSFFTIVEKEEEVVQSNGILVNAKKNQVKCFEKYLKQVLKMILKTIKKYEVVSIDKIDGFNYKYVVDYSVANIKKQLSMLIFVKEDGNLDFRISNIDGANVNISGTIEESFYNIKTNWYEENDNLKGSIIYNSKEQIIQEKLYKGDILVVNRETSDTLLTEDELLISFYLKLLNLKELNNVMKIDDNCYFLSNSNLLKNDEEGIIYKNESYLISIFDDEVIIKQNKKVGISKYNNQVKVLLDDILSEYTLKKIIINDKHYVLIENKYQKNDIKNYSYNVLEIPENKSFLEMFDIENKFHIDEELKTFDGIKRYIKNRERGIE